MATEVGVKCLPYAQQLQTAKWDDFAGVRGYRHVGKGKSRIQNV